MMSLEGTRVVVVGGTSGMGRATASGGPLLEQDLAAARTFVDGKLLGSWMCARYAAPRMRAGGSITFVTDSEMWSGLTVADRDQLRRSIADAVPVGRMGTPEDIAHAAVFLMTNRQTTGAVLEVSGGEPLVEPVEVR